MRSVVLDPRPQVLDVTFAEMLAIDQAQGPIPRAEIDSLLFVVDTTNTPTGRSGSVWVDDLQLERAAQP